MVSKEILKQYTDLQQERQMVQSRIRQTEKQLKKINEEGTVKDKVTGGEGGLQHFAIEGFPIPEYSRKRTLLMARRNTLAGLEMEIAETLNHVEEFIASIDDSRIRRIITYRFIDELTWNQIADQLGGNNTEDSVKKTFYRFMEK